MELTSAEWEKRWNAMERRFTRLETALGAIRACWGGQTEGAFRSALRGILQDYMEVEVSDVVLNDDKGEVLGHPEQVELDVVVKDGKVLVCEIKFSVSRADVAHFNRKVDFYTKQTDRKVDRKVIISPMVDGRAERLAHTLGIEVYSYADDVPL